MNKVLIVEDSKVISIGLRRWIKQDLQLDCDIAHSMEEARKCIETSASDYFVALLDLNLPDAPQGEIVDYMVGQDIPSIVVTGTFDERMRKIMLQKSIVDYVVKSHPKDMPQLLKLIQRIYNNRSTKALIVDDSRQYRRHYTRLLRNQRLQIFAAEDGLHALEILQANPDIRLVITDYHMPRMNGYELVQAIRQKYSEDMLSIIVFSTDDSEGMSPKFLKVGANDFISKTATVEEFLCRINMNLNLLDLVTEIRESANRDFLTKIFNRKYFFEYAEQIYARHKKEDRPLVVAMADIDFFKKVNDVYGHHAGDMVIKSLAHLLRDQCQDSGIVARFGGEEFCMLLTSQPKTGIVDFFENLRILVQDTKVVVDEQVITFTTSVGVTSCLGNSLADMINAADQLLYKAKQGGRNRVCFS